MSIVPQSFVIKDDPRGQPPRKPRYQPMLLAVVPLSIGILIDRCLDPAFANWVLSMIAAGAAWSLLFWMSARKSQPSSLLTSLCLIVWLAAIGGAWHHVRWNWFAHDHIAAYVQGGPERCCVRGTLLCEPRKTIQAESDHEIDPLQSPERTRLVVRVSDIRDGREWLNASGVIDLIVHAPVTSIRAGDRLQAVGKLVGMRPATNPGQFDFQTYMRSRGRLANMHVYHAQSVAVIQPANRWSAGTLLSAVRQRFNAVAWRLIDADEVGFATAILMGNREHLSPERRAVFLETGTAHLLAISGLHVGILAGSIFLLFRLGLVSRRKCLLGTIAFVFCYAWLVEFRPTVLRAAVLISLYCLGRLVCQRGYSFNLLAAAAWIVLMINPSNLMSVGPQLSFLAVATLAFCGPWIWWPRDTDPIKQLVARTRPGWLRGLNHVGRGFRATVLASVLIWFFAAPLVAFHFHLVAPIGLVLNPLLMLPMAVGLYSGAATLLLGVWADWPAVWFAWVCEWTLGCIEATIQFAQGLPMSHFWTAGPSAVSLACFYGGVLVLSVFPPTRLPGRWVGAFGLLWLVFGWALPSQLSYSKSIRLESTRPPALTCTFIDVGHGTSVLVQDSVGQNLLYDCGSFGSSKWGAQNISGTLWAEGIVHLDAVILSHADVDHFNALPTLSRRFSIGAVYVSPQMLGSDSPAVHSVFRQLSERSIDVRTLLAGHGSCESGGLQVEVVAPTTAALGSTDNADSVVIRIEADGQSVMLPGDLEAESLVALLSRPENDCDVLMLAHHGSHNSLPEQWVAWSTPKVIVASCGRGRLRRDVADAMHESEGKFFRTDKDGAVRVTMSAGSIEVQTHSTGQWVNRGAE